MSQFAYAFLSPKLHNLEKSSLQSEMSQLIGVINFVVIEGLQGDD